MRKAFFSNLPQMQVFFCCTDHDFNPVGIIFNLFSKMSYESSLISLNHLARVWIHTPRYVENAAFQRIYNQCCVGEVFIQKGMMKNVDNMVWCFVALSRLNRRGLFLYPDWKHGPIKTQHESIYDEIDPSIISRPDYIGC